MKKIIALITFAFSMSAYGGSKINVSAGYYSLSATNSGQSFSTSGIGAYEVSYFHTLTNNLEIGVGYNLTLSKGISGDSNYGPSVMMNYYPITFANSQVVNHDGVRFEASENYRPYLGVAFHQRQYQSAQISLAGFGVQVGVEKHLYKRTYLTAELRYIPMRGNSNLSATETNALVGLSFGF